MYLCFIISFPSVFYVHERFREHRQSYLWLLHGAICLSEERQNSRSPELCSCGTPSSHALVHLLDPFFDLSLLRQRPAPQERTSRHPVLKSLFLGEADSSFSTL